MPELATVDALRSELSEVVDELLLTQRERDGLQQRLAAVEAELERRHRQEAGNGGGGGAADDALAAALFRNNERVCAQTSQMLEALEATYAKCFDDADLARRLPAVRNQIQLVKFKAQQLLRTVMLERFAVLDTAGAMAGPSRRKQLAALEERVKQECAGDAGFPARSPNLSVAALIDVEAELAQSAHVREMRAELERLRQRMQTPPAAAAAAPEPADSATIRELRVQLRSAQAQLRDQQRCEPTVQDAARTMTAEVQRELQTAQAQWELKLGGYARRLAEAERTLRQTEAELPGLRVRAVTSEAECNAVRDRAKLLQERVEHLENQLHAQEREAISVLSAKFADLEAEKQQLSEKLAVARRQSDAGSSSSSSVGGGAAAADDDELEALVARSDELLRRLCGADPGSCASPPRGASPPRRLAQNLSTAIDMAVQLRERLSLAEVRNEVCQEMIDSVESVFEALKNERQDAESARKELVENVLERTSSEVSQLFASLAKGDQVEQLMQRVDAANRMHQDEASAHAETLQELRDARILLDESRERASGLEVKVQHEQTLRRGVETSLAAAQTSWEARNQLANAAEAAQRDLVTVFAGLYPDMLAATTAAFEFARSTSGQDIGPPPPSPDAAPVLPTALGEWAGWCRDHLGDLVRKRKVSDAVVWSAFEAAASAASAAAEREHPASEVLADQLASTQKSESRMRKRIKELEAMLDKDGRLIAMLEDGLKREDGRARKLRTAVDTLVVAVNTIQKECVAFRSHLLKSADPYQDMTAWAKLETLDVTAEQIAKELRRLGGSEAPTPEQLSAQSSRDGLN